MDIEKRIRKLEFTNRLLLALALIAVVGATTGYVKADRPVRKITADSVVTHSLTVVNQLGKQSAKIFVGDDGSVGLNFYGTSGKLNLSIYSDPAGSPSICLGDRHTCRLAIGYVFRNNCPELSFQLRDENGKSIWMPSTVNQFTPNRTPQVIIDKCQLGAQ